MISVLLDLTKPSRRPSGCRSLATIDGDKTALYNKRIRELVPKIKASIYTQRLFLTQEVTTEVFCYISLCISEETFVR